MTRDCPMCGSTYSGSGAVCAQCYYGKDGGLKERPRIERRQPSKIWMTVTAAHPALAVKTLLMFLGVSDGKSP